MLLFDIEYGDLASKRVINCKKGQFCLLQMWLFWSVDLMDNLINIQNNV